MSSHHFVKEGQEPALLILETIRFAVVEPLLEWAPQIIILEHALDEVIRWGIKIDVVLAANINDEILRQKLLSQTPVKILSSGASDVLETALYFLISSKQKAVNIVVIDPVTLFPKLENFLDQIAIGLLTEKVKWSAISSGTYKKWLPLGSMLFVHGDVDFNLTENLKRHDTHFEVINDGFVALAAEKPFWIGESDQN